MASENTNDLSGKTGNVTKDVTSVFSSDLESIDDGLLLAVIEAWPNLNPSRRKMIAAILGQGRPS